MLRALFLLLTFSSTLVWPYVDISTQSGGINTSSFLLEVELADTNLIDQITDLQTEKESESESSGTFLNLLEDFLHQPFHFFWPGPEKAGFGSCYARTLKGVSIELLQPPKSGH